MAGYSEDAAVRYLFGFSRLSRAPLLRRVVEIIVVEEGGFRAAHGVFRCVCGRVFRSKWSLWAHCGGCPEFRYAVKEAISVFRALKRSLVRKNGNRWCLDGYCFDNITQLAQSLHTIKLNGSGLEYILLRGAKQ